MNDYKYLDGIAAYEYFSGNKIENSNISIVRYSYSTGVLLYHPTIGFKIYCDIHKSRYKNQLEVLKVFDKIKNLDENTLSNYKHEVEWR